MLGWLLLLLAIVLLIGSLVVFFWDDLRSFSDKHFYKNKVYKVLKYYCDEEDQLLLNDVYLYLQGDSDELTHFDHIVLADKYVYVISDFYAYGGIYGNITDSSLFVRDYHDHSGKIENPVLVNEAKVRKLEASLEVDPRDHMFVSVVVYNNSLQVPAGIGKKEQSSWFLPVKDLEKTLKQAEKDDVSPISHKKTEALLAMLKKRSDLIKQEVVKPKKKKSKQE